MPTKIETAETAVRVAGDARLELAAFTGSDLLSIDVEDYFQVEAFADRITRADWPHFSSRVQQNTARILDLLDEFGHFATFFVLGWVAEREKALVRAIVERGHEVACHSHLHRRVFTLSPQEFRSDLRRARAAIEDAAGCAVFGFRAPTFSVREDCFWALDILAEEGFIYDSSIFPIRHDLYGVPDAPRFIHEHRLANGKRLIEVPPSTTRLFGINLGVGGGGYLRHLPMAFTRWGMTRIHREQQPVNVYFHPWEIDPEQPRIRASKRSSLRHYRGLHNMMRRLRELMAEGQFEPILSYVRRFEAGLTKGN